MIGVRKFIFLMVIAAFIFIPFGSSAVAKVSTTPSADPDPAGMIADCLVARPVGLASLVVGATSFIVSLPFSALGHNVNQAYRLMIVDPAKYTFSRPLGGYWD